MKNTDCIIEQYRGGKLVRFFTPTGDQALPWCMNVNGKTYLRTHGWVMSKILPTLMEGSSIITKVVPVKEVNSEDQVSEPSVAFDDRFSRKQE